MGLANLFDDIKEQPMVFLDHTQAFRSVIETIQSLKIESDFVFTGIATSFYAWEAAAMHLRTIGNSKVNLIDTSNLLYYDYPFGRDLRPIFVLSRSGESAEIIKLVNMVAEKRQLIAITENENSPLARKATYLFKFNANEKAYSNTKSFTLSLAYALSIDIGLGYPFPMGLEKWVNQTVDSMSSMLQNWQSIQDVASLLSQNSALIIDGQGYLTGVTNQAALDFQEIRFLAIPVTESILRHGPIELTVRPDIVVVMLLLNDHTTQRKLELIYELYDQNTPVVAVVTGTTRVDRPIPLIRIPETKEELQPILFSLAMQQIFACTAQSGGIEIIQPTLVDKVTRKE